MNTEICLGTAAIGRPVYINIKQQQNDRPFDFEEFKKNGIDLLNFAYNSGINHFDTAPGYGIAETLLFEWLKNNATIKAKISSKWGYSYEAGFNKNAQIHELKEHSLNRLSAQWEDTKKLLPHLKLYQIHSATIESGVFDNQDILKNLHRIKKEYGVSIGFTSTGSNQNEIIRRGLKIKVNNELLFSSVQATYNVFEQSLGEIVNYVKDSGVNLIIKESLANGRVFKNSNYMQHAGLYAFIDKLCIKYSVTPDTVALRFVIDSIAPSMLLLGASTQQQLLSNMNYKHFMLEKSDIEKIQELKQNPVTYWNERLNLKWN